MFDFLTQIFSLITDLIDSLFGLLDWVWEAFQSIVIMINGAGSITLLFPFYLPPQLAGIILVLIAVCVIMAFLSFFGSSIRKG